MNKITKISAIMIIFILCFAALYGCEKKECSNSSDCTDKTCQKITGCQKGKCVYSTINNCCGNKKCEDKENECTCGKDCGECEKKTTKSLKYECSEKKECMASVITPERKSETAQTTVGDSNLFATYSMDDPFILGYSKFNVKYEIKELDPEMKDIRIKQVKVFQKGVEKASSAMQMIGEKTLNQVLWDANTKIDENTILDFNMDPEAKNETKETVTIEVETTYEYTDMSREKEETKTNSFKTTIKQKMNVVNPGKTVIQGFLKCRVNECDDGNACTRDICENYNGFEYCSNQYIIDKPCKGNKVCDAQAGENNCNARDDCGNCEREFGQYIGYVCSEANKCVTAVKDEALAQEKSLRFDSSESSFKLEIKPTFNQPFIVGKDKMKVIIIPREFSSSFVSLTILDVGIVDGEQVLGERVGVNQLIAAKDTPYNFEIDASFAMLKNVPEEKRRPKLRLMYRVVNKVNNADKEDTGDMTFSLEDVYFVNPEQR